MSTSIKATLIPIGGNEDKGENEYFGIDFIEEGILSHVLREAGGKDQALIIIPTASSIPEEVGDNYLKAFGKLGCTQLSVQNIQSRAQAEAPETLAAFAQARCLMFSGGDQSKIVEYIGGTSLHQLILKRLAEDENFVLAGTSAGAMCMSEQMIAGGSGAESLIKGNVLMREGMGFIPELIIDSHFVKRGRFGRLAEAVAAYPHRMGVGLSEDTGLVIKEGKRFKVIGSGMVVLFDPIELQHNNHNLLSEGTPMTMTRLITHVLANGDKFRFDERKIEVLPLHEDFI